MINDRILIRPIVIKFINVIYKFIILYIDIYCMNLWHIYVELEMFLEAIASICVELDFFFSFLHNHDTILTKRYTTY
jgi:hypothetical protein